MPLVTRRLAMVLLSVTMLSACDESVTGPSVTLDATFTMAPADTVTVAGTSVRLQFKGVEGDSRCPADAVCITGGDAVVRITAVTGRTTRDYELHTGNLKPVTYDGLTIALVELAPYPFSSRTIAQGDYRATLRVTR